MKPKARANLYALERIQTNKKICSKTRSRPSVEFMTHRNELQPSSVVIIVNLILFSFDFVRAHVTIEAHADSPVNAKVTTHKSKFPFNLYSHKSFFFINLKKKVQIEYNSIGSKVKQKEFLCNGNSLSRESTVCVIARHQSRAAVKTFDDLSLTSPALHKYLHDSMNASIGKENEMSLANRKLYSADTRETFPRFYATK